MIPDNLRTAEYRLRRAVERRQYEALLRLVEDLRLAADAHMATLPAWDPLRRLIAAWAVDTIEWARLMLATQRQIWLHEMENLPLVARYLEDAEQSGHAVSLDL